MKHLFYICLFFLIGCGEKEYSREEVKRLLTRGEKEDLVEAFYLIGENRDTSFLRDVIDKPNDPRIVHTAAFKGMSVYQSKMVALRKISGVSPPTKITYEPNSVIIDFYCKWISENTSLGCDVNSPQKN